MDVMNLFENSNLVSEDYGAKFKGSYKEIATVFGAKRLGFLLCTLDPKTFSCPYHWHTEEEELVIILEGEAMLRKNGEFRKVKAGDLIYHGTGPTTAHHMYNHSEIPLRYFVLSTQFPQESCHYPDSRKVLVRTPRSVTQDGIEVDYLKDESDPSVYWPESALRGEIP